MEGLSPHQVRGYQAAGKQHGEEQIEGKYIPAWQLLTGERISIQGGEQQVAYRTDQSHQKRNAIAADHCGGFRKQILIGIGAEFCRKKAVAVRNQSLFLGEGGHNQQDERRNRAYNEKTQQDVGKNLEPFSIFYHNLLPPS